MFKNRHYLRVKGWKIYSKQMGSGKKAGVLIQVSAKADLKLNQKRHSRTHHFEGITTLNIYAHNFIKRILLNFKALIKPKPVMVGDVNNTLSLKERSSPHTKKSEY